MSQAGATPSGALSRVAYTFQYNDTTKRISVIGPIPAGTVALVDPDYPSISGSKVVSITYLTEGGLPAAEIIYGIAPGTDLPAGAPIIPTGALADGVSKSDLTNNMLNITFQPDGTVIDTAGSPLNKALYLYNKSAAQSTSSAISVLGSSGRIKVWRYNKNGNVYQE
jgi:hypothetical protein